MFRSEFYPPLPHSHFLPKGQSAPVIVVRASSDSRQGQWVPLAGQDESGIVVMTFAIRKRRFMPLTVGGCTVHRGSRSGRRWSRGIHWQEAER